MKLEEGLTLVLKVYLRCKWSAFPPKEGGYLRRPNQSREGQEGPTPGAYRSGNRLGHVIRADKPWLRAFGSLPSHKRSSHGLTLLNTHARVHTM